MFRESLCPRKLCKSRHSFMGAELCSLSQNHSLFSVPIAAIPGDLQGVIALDLLSGFPDSMLPRGPSQPTVQTKTNFWNMSNDLILSEAWRAMEHGVAWHGEADGRVQAGATSATQSGSCKSVIIPEPQFLLLTNEPINSSYERPHRSPALWHLSKKMWGVPPVTGSFKQWQKLFMF